MFEWNEAKNRANIAKHGISFQTAIRIFDGPVLTEIDDREDYGEDREISLGVIDGTVVLAVIHTDRMSKVRIISARRATCPERSRYEEEIRQRTHS